MEVAAEALRQAEVEAVQTEVSSIDSTQLEGLSIDELRAIAAELDVPNRGQIVEQDELIAAIRQRM
jgi:cell division FtsZ-interacting protein ZapD